MAAFATLDRSPFSKPAKRPALQSAAKLQERVASQWPAANLCPDTLDGKASHAGPFRAFRCRQLPCRAPRGDSCRELWDC